MTVNSAFKKRVRARMKETGEKYTEARRALKAEDIASGKIDPDREDRRR